MKKINFSVVVFGQQFTENFLEYTIPAFLSPRNLPAVCRGRPVEYFIYTGRDVEHMIRSHPSFARLNQLLPTRLVFLDDLNPKYLQSTVYENLNLGHMHFIRESNAQNAAMVFFSPDILWSEGTFESMIRHAEEGRRAILVMGIRTNREDVLGELRKIPYENRYRGIPARELSQMVVRFPHRITQSLYWGSKEFDLGWPSTLLWKVGNEGFLCRAFHVHTLYVDPRTPALPGVNHDFDWLSELGFKHDDFYLATNTDEMSLVEFSPKDRGLNCGPAGKSTLFSVAKFISKYACADHRQYFLENIYVHTGDISSPAWRRAKLSAFLVSRTVLILARLLPLMKTVRNIFRSLQQRYRSAKSTS
jgi:hypothetical protein